MSKPLLIFDGDCGFCLKWIAYWKTLTRDRVDYAPYQEVGGRYPGIPVEKFQEAVQLIDSEGTVRSGARAVVRVLSEVPGFRGLNWAFERLPGVSRACEAVYKVVARNRVFFSRVTRVLWGEDPLPTRMSATRRLYLKALGVTYLAAFASFWTQSSGLVGPQGILPIGWSEATLHALCAGGVAASVLLVLGVWPTVAAIAAWIGYWFITQAGQDFLGFQWDALMLEMGFFSIFLTFRRLAPARVAVLILRWLLFRVVFFSGYVKLASGDPTWRGLTALQYHFETQPLPTWIGWWFHQLPLWVLRGGAAGMFVVELGVPFLFFLPRKPRIFAFFAILALQILIDLTGNYGFFGWQVMTLSLLLLDDAWFEQRLPRIVGWLRAPREPRFAGVRAVLGSVLLGGAAIFVVLTTVFPVTQILVLAAPLDVIHRYGVFANMTTQRNELIFEGSDDGEHWLAYELRWKPGDLHRGLAFCEPHMPRLDWLLWFAARGAPEQNLWVQAVAVRLLQQSEPVLAFFEANPFPKTAPRFVRVAFYRYHFTDIDTRRKTGQYWSREPEGLYLEPVQLRHF